MKPLQDILVVALEQAVAAPFCTCRLADAGARVIKVERPEGDFARNYDDVAEGLSSYFVWLNRGKESVVLDLSTVRDRALLERILAQADVLVQNLKLGAIARLGFSPERLRKEHRRLILCSISGYGGEGPMASRKAYDLLVQAESGLASLTGGPDAPARVGISITDIATGATAYAAILEALIERARTGQGIAIDISMFDVMADWLTVPLLHAEAGRPPKRVGLAHPSIAPYGVFKSRDEADVLISVQSDREWRVLCEQVLMAADLADDPRFSTNVARVHSRRETDEAVSKVFSSLDRHSLLARLDAAEIAFAEVNDMRGLSTHPHLRRTTVGAVSTSIDYPGPAPIFDGRARTFGAVPSLGEHTSVVRQEFGS
jgi:itaconate CoA-transferase